MASTLGRAALAALIACLLLSGLSRADPVVFNAANYTSLADSDSSETIAPGTRITVENWQQYKRFLPYSMQVLYAGKYRWRVGATPDYTVTVGPTIPYRWPRQYLMDTEKYDQARLKRLDSGGYAVTNYVAGLPFAIPTEPGLAAKVMYNWRYAPAPAVTLYFDVSLSLDSSLNMRRDDLDYLYYRLSHLSTPGVPPNPWYGKDYLSSSRVTFTTPGDNLYLVSLNLQPDDATLPYERYAFIPSLRRPLRISSTAPCSYETGVDTLRDETFSYFRLGTYKFTLLGEKKLLFLVHAGNEPSAYGVNSINLKDSSLPGWPKPAMGKWELRDVYVVDATPLPVDGPGCLEHRISYVDKDAWIMPLWEDYDDQGRLWEAVITPFTERADNARDGDYMVEHGLLIVNLKENHVTPGTNKAPPELDDEVPAQYRDAALEATPSAVHAINR
jgi:uncharacterized protein DUF1329